MLDPAVALSMPKLPLPYDCTLSFGVEPEEVRVGKTGMFVANPPDGVPVLEVDGAPGPPSLSISSNSATLSSSCFTRETGLPESYIHSRCNFVQCWQVGFSAEHLIRRLRQ